MYAKPAYWSCLCYLTTLSLCKLATMSTRRAAPSQTSLSSPEDWFFRTSKEPELANAAAHPGGASGQSMQAEECKHLLSQSFVDKNAEFAKKQDVFQQQVGPTANSVHS